MNETLSVTEIWKRRIILCLRIRAMGIQSSFVFVCQVLISASSIQIWSKNFKISEIFSMSWLRQIKTAWDFHWILKPIRIHSKNWRDLRAANQRKIGGLRSRKPEIFIAQDNTQNCVVRNLTIAAVVNTYQVYFFISGLTTLALLQVLWGFLFINLVPLYQRAHMHAQRSVAHSHTRHHVYFLKFSVVLRT